MQTSLLNTTQTTTPQTSSITSAMTNEASDLFTKLLVAQIKNQNPLEPTDPSEFVGQLTQLSQMESLQKLASQNVANASMLQSLQILAMGGQVGSQVSVISDHVTLGSQTVEGSFTLANASTEVALVLKGADGVEHKVALGTQSAGNVAFSLDPTKLGLSGTYDIRVSSSSQENPAVEIMGVLNNVRLASDGNVVLNVAHVGEVLPVSITQFNGRQAEQVN